MRALLAILVSLNLTACLTGDNEVETDDQTQTDDFVDDAIGYDEFTAVEDEQYGEIHSYLEWLFGSDPTTQPEAPPPRHHPRYDDIIRD